MSGIFGAVDSHRRSVHRTAHAIASRLRVFPTQQTEWYCSPSQSEAIGRVWIGIYNQEPQPCWNGDQTVGVVFAGRLIRDRSPSPLTADVSDAQWVLTQYQEHGEQCTDYLLGSFALAIYDGVRRKVLVAADRMGTYPIYYGHRAGHFRFGPTQNSLIGDDLYPAEIDLTALAQFMRFQQLLEDVSFFSHVRLLEWGQQLVYDIERDTLAKRQYWRPDPAQPLHSKLSFEDAADETVRLIVQAVDRCCQGQARIGLFLSGGMDSRIILAALGQLGYAPPTLTYGLPTSRDAYYADLVARRVGVSHHVCYRADGEWVKQYWQPHLRLTDGSHSWIHMHGIYALEEARALMDVNLSGFAGDLLLRGLVLKRSYLEAPDEMTYAAAVFKGMNTEENWPGMSETDEQLLYTQDIFSLVKGRAFDSLRRSLAPYLVYPEPVRTELYFSLTGDIRHYAHYLDFYRSTIEVGLPFTDPDLVDFVRYLPTSYRADRRLASAVLRRLSPALSTVPYDLDELLPTDRAFLRSAHRFWKRSSRKLSRVFGMGKQPNRSTLHSDYENWLRDGLRSWAEDILFDERVAARGFFDPGFIRSLWQRHLAGKEQWTLGKVAPIIGYELMLREFVDNAPLQSTADA